VRGKEVVGVGLEGRDGELQPSEEDYRFTRSNVPIVQGAAQAERLPRPLSLHLAPDGNGAS
jgi:hypothetical protein